MLSAPRLRVRAQKYHRGVVSCQEGGRCCILRRYALAFLSGLGKWTYVR